MVNNPLTAPLLAVVFAGIGFSAPFQLNTNEKLQSLSASERVLVDGSRRVIVSTGMSAEYFNAHFKVRSIVDKPSDRRVVWQFSINGYDALVPDSISSYLIGTRRVDEHGIAYSLGQASEIQRTISRTQALKILKTCIGKFDNPSVEYRSVNSRAQLLLVAEASKPVNEQTQQEDLQSRRPREQDAKSTDVIRSEGDKHRTMFRFASVNLQT